MKKQILCAGLIAISLQGQLCAQEKKSPAPTRTQANFNIPENLINNRHIVYFPKDEKMIIELQDAGDYNMLHSFDSSLAVFRKDIEFYKDSLNGAGSVRIDYSVTSGAARKMIRFKKYEPDGDIYTNKSNETAKLKFDQDTIRIAFHKYMAGPAKHDAEKEAAGTDIAVQVTFCLNNYAQIDKIIANNVMLDHIIDTLEAASRSKRKAGALFNANSIGYRPFDTSIHDAHLRFKKVNYLFDHEKDVWSTMGTLMFNGSLGVGLIKNTLAPMADIGIEINEKWKIMPRTYSFIRLSATPYFFFDKDLQNHTLVNDNWFVNFEFGGERNSRRNSVGFSYLYANKGDYFQNNTFKAFINMSLAKHCSIVPEIIFNNNFRQIFPGITLRVF